MIAVAGPELLAHHRPADHARPLGQHDLDHAHLLRPVGEVDPARRQQLDAQLMCKCGGIGIRHQQIDEQHVTHGEAGD